MSRKNKLSKFADVLEFKNVVENFGDLDVELIIQAGQKVDLVGKWASDFFCNDLPVTLELACGRGEYTLALSRAYPERNFLGVDIKGARIWKGAKTALEEGIQNAGFLRSRIELIDKYFEKSEVEEIWITFPDPFHGKENRRLTGKKFLEKYRNILKTGGYINLKTDDDQLFEFSKEVAESCDFVQVEYANDDIYGRGQLDFETLEHKTYYEMMHLGNGKTIKFLRCSLL